MAEDDKNTEKFLRLLDAISDEVLQLSDADIMSEFGPDLTLPPIRLKGHKLRHAYGNVHTRPGLDKFLTVIEELDEAEEERATAQPEETHKS